MEFEWDDAKDEANIAKHGIAFATARRIFGGVTLVREDSRRDYGETREISIGKVDEAVIVVAHTRREERMRLISARAPHHARKEGRTMSTRKTGSRQSPSNPRSRDRALAPAEIAEIPDDEIDFSDIPELDEAFWREAELVEPDRTEQITLRVKRSVLDHFRAPGRGYQTRINQVLESYVRARSVRRG